MDPEQVLKDLFRDSNTNAHDIMFEEEEEKSSKMQRVGLQMI